jgi:hypothetical protein
MTQALYADMNNKIKKKVEVRFHPPPLLITKLTFQRSIVTSVSLLATALTLKDISAVIAMGQCLLLDSAHLLFLLLGLFAAPSPNSPTGSLYFFLVLFTGSFFFLLYNCWYLGGFIL